MSFCNAENHSVMPAAAYVLDEDIKDYSVCLQVRENFYNANFCLNPNQQRKILGMTLVQRAA